MDKNNNWKKKMASKNGEKIITYLFLLVFKLCFLID